MLHKCFLWKEAQRRMNVYPSVVGILGGGRPVGLPRMNLEMHLHLIQNKLLMNFSLNLHLKSERYRRGLL